MPELLAALEQLAPIRALKASFVAYPLVNAMHIAAIGALWTSIVLMDLRVLGALRSLPGPAFLATLRRVALIALAVAAVTGAALFCVRATHYASLPVFQVKLGLILLAGANLAAFTLVRRGSVASSPTGAAERWLAAMSATIWTGVLLAGRFIGFV